PERESRGAGAGPIQVCADDPLPRWIRFSDRAQANGTVRYATLGSFFLRARGLQRSVCQLPATRHPRVRLRNQWNARRGPGPERPIRRVGPAVRREQSELFGVEFVTAPSGRPGRREPRPTRGPARFGPPCPPEGVRIPW